MVSHRVGQVEDHEPHVALQECWEDVGWVISDSDHSASEPGDDEPAGEDDDDDGPGGPGGGEVVGEEAALDVPDPVGCMLALPCGVGPVPVVHTPYSTHVLIACFRVVRARARRGRAT